MPLAEKLLEVPQELIRTALELELQEGAVIADRVGETPRIFLAGLHTASFDGRPVTYGFGELDALVPAYAASIHKSQGSEYPAVLIPVMTQHYAMLQRNLLYTGGWSQAFDATLYLRRKGWSGWRWSEDTVEASMWWLRRSYGTGGGVENR